MSRIIVQDTREKQPWDLSKHFQVLVEKLECGDYSAKELDKFIVIERKASPNELFHNFANERDRLKKEFEKMAEYKHKFIVIESTMEEVLSSENYYVNTSNLFRGKNSNAIPAIVIRGLHEATFDYGIHVVYAGKKGMAITRGLLNRAFEINGIKP